MSLEKMPWKSIGWSALGLFLLLFPFIPSPWPRYILYIFTRILIFALFATSFNLVLGYAGMLSFGHAAFYGLGAYACALLVVKASVPPALAFLASPLFASAAALLIGFFCVRLRETFYFVMLTLAFAQLLYTVVFKWRSFTYGDDGIQGVPVPELLETQINYYYFVLIIVAISLSVLFLITRSPFGQILRSMRENPERSEFVGINVRNYRLLAFVISAFFSGIAGALYLMLDAKIDPPALYWTTSGDVVLMSLIGGMFVYLGPAVGAAVFIILETVIEMSEYLKEYWRFFLGATFILIVLFFPDGILGTLRNIFASQEKAD